MTFYSTAKRTKHQPACFQNNTFVHQTHRFMDGKGDLPHTLDLNPLWGYPKKWGWISPAPFRNNFLGPMNSQAAGKFEACDLRAPIEGSARFQILGGVEERAIVTRVDADGAVVAPPAQAAQLRACAVFYRGLCL